MKKVLLPIISIIIRSSKNSLIACHINWQGNLAFNSNCDVEPCMEGLLSGGLKGHFPLPYPKAVQSRLAAFFVAIKNPARSLTPITTNNQNIKLNRLSLFFAQSAHLVINPSNSTHFFNK